MAYDREVYAQAMHILQERQDAAAAAAERLRADSVRRHPRLREIELALADTGAKLSRAILAGGDIDNAVTRIQAENEALQREMADILAADGLPVNNFQPQPFCSRCGDTGYVHGKMCGCLLQLLKESAAARVCKGFMDAPARFSDLSLDFYDTVPPEGRGLSPRERMRQVFRYCEQYADSFDTDAPSLLLRGPTGTGKTHVSLAIAAAVAANGFAVLYQPAGKLFSILEREHFGKQNGDTEAIAASCDLLVIDDLGTEFETSFATATLYTLINTRMLDGLPTIISTNLTQEGLQTRYGDQIVSRITGAFEPLLFVGKDIRQQKRAQAMRQ